MNLRVNYNQCDVFAHTIYEKIPHVYKVHCFGRRIGNNKYAWDSFRSSPRYSAHVIPGKLVVLCNVFSICNNQCDNIVFCDKNAK